MTGALTMLTEASCGESSPVSAIAVNGLTLSSAIAPSYSTATDLMPVSVSCPAKLPSCSASFM